MRSLLAASAGGSGGRRLVRAVRDGIERGVTDRRRLSAPALGFGLAAVIALVDQIVKWVIVYPLSLETIGQIRLVSFFDLTFMRNFGVSFGALSASTDTGRWLLVALTAGIAIAIAVWLRRERVRADAIPLGMILGGAIGNIIDRARLGYVIDYADLHFGEFRPFAIFNVADAAISIGVLLLIARSLLVRDKDANTGAATPRATEEVTR